MTFPQLPPIPKGFTIGWAKQKLAQHLRENVQNMYFMFEDGPLYHWEAGWYIHLILNNNTYDEYVILPDGRVLPGTPPT
jgi:hypothetical protein